MTEQLEKAKQYVILDYLKEYMRGELEENPEEHITDPELLKIVKSVNKSRKEKAEKHPYALITINPRPDSDLQEFVELVHKSIKKKWITEYIYTFEQRGTKEDKYGTGHHCHMLLYREGKRPSELSREFHNTFKHLIGNAKHIDIRYVSEKDADNCRAYINGDKKDEKKKAKCEADDLWRTENALEKVYLSH